MPLRITFLTTSFPLSPNSVSGLFVAKLVSSLARHVEIRVITPASSEARLPAVFYDFQVTPFRYAPSRLERLAHAAGGIPVALRENPWRYLLVPSFLVSMSISVWRQSRNSDILHANWAISGLMLGLIGKLLKKPIVTTLRGEDVNRLEGINGWILRTAMKLSDAVVTVSKSFEILLTDRYPGFRTKLCTITNGVDESFLRVGRERSIVMKSSVRLLTVGSLIPRKGVDQILRALSKLPESDKFHLDIVGDGSLRSDLENLTRELNLEPCITFHGNKTSHEVVSFLAAADIFVFASHSEGRPNVILEALAAGLPIVASNIPGVNELVIHEETGVLFSDGKVDELSDRLHQLINHFEQRATYARAAHNFIVEQGLTWDFTAQNYLSLYNTLLRK